MSKATSDDATKGTGDPLKNETARDLPGATTATGEPTGTGARASSPPTGDRFADQQRGDLPSDILRADHERLAADVNDPTRLPVLYQEVSLSGPRARGSSPLKRWLVTTDGGAEVAICYAVDESESIRLCTSGTGGLKRQLKVRELTSADLRDYPLEHSPEAERQRKAAEERQEKAEQERAERLRKE